MTTDRLSATFSALANPTRRAILGRLALGETTVSELAKPFKMSGPAVSKHLKVLERAGLIARSRAAQWRPCRIEAAAFKPVDDWLAVLIVEKTITPCLWFDTQAEEAANFYVSVFKNSRIGKISRYGKAGQDVHKKKDGSVMTVEFELGGQKFTALNGGPNFKFTEAVSFQIFCDTQDEIDYFWNALSKGGQEGPCGWLKDKYGLSWQVVPSVIPKMMSDPDSKKSERVMNAFLKMKKFDLEQLTRAYEGQSS